MPFAGVLMSAILSTVDSCLLAGSSLVTHNVVLPLRPGLSESARLRVSRVGVLSLGVFAFVLALSSASIKDLVEFASAFESAGVFVVACFEFTATGGVLSAWAGLCTGFVVWEMGVWAGSPAPYVTALAASLVAYVAMVPCSPGTTSAPPTPAPPSV